MQRFPVKLARRWGRNSEEGTEQQLKMREKERERSERRKNKVF